MEEGGFGAYSDGVLVHVLATDVDRLPQGQSQSLALAQGVVDGAAVLANDLALQVEEVAACIFLALLLFHKAYIVPIGHKADILALPLVGIDKS